MFRYGVLLGTITLVSALYDIFFSKTNIRGIISISFSIRSNQNIFFVFICRGHILSNTLQPFYFQLILAKFDHFWTVGFSLIWISHENDNFTHHLHYNVYKIKSKHFLRFLMSWSQRERHIATHSHTHTHTRSDRQKILQHPFHILWSISILDRG